MLLFPPCWFWIEEQKHMATTWLNKDFSKEETYTDLHTLEAVHQLRSSHSLPRRLPDCFHIKHWSYRLKWSATPQSLFELLEDASTLAAHQRAPERIGAFHSFLQIGWPSLQSLTGCGKPEIKRVPFTKLPLLPLSAPPLSALLSPAQHCVNCVLSVCFVFFPNFMHCKWSQSRQAVFHKLQYDELYKTGGKGVKWQGIKMAYLFLSLLERTLWHQHCLIVEHEFISSHQWRKALK